MSETIYLSEILKEKDVECSIVNTFCFSKENTFLLLSARSDKKDLQVSALIKIELSKIIKYKVLHEFNSGSHDYHAENPNLHYILASGGYIHKIENDNMTLYPYATDKYLSKIARISPSAIAIFGERGHVFKFENNEYNQIPTPTDEELKTMHFPRPEYGFSGGNYGAFLEGNSKEFSSFNLGNNEFILGLHVKQDGTVLIGCEDGAAMVYADKKVKNIENDAADIYAINEFQGVEYWGDDDFGIFMRSDTILIPKFETGYAFNINVTDLFMTINAGYWVYIFDGTNWVQLKINTDIKNLIEQIPLDFVPK